jgi:hypothetical protein
MKQEIKDYIKCAATNRATLAGYIFSSIGVAGLYFTPNPTKEFVPYMFLIYASISSIGLSLLAVSALGLDTYQDYTRTKKHIEQHGKIDSRYLKNCSKLYCNRVGLELAIKEARLEETLNRQTKSLNMQ